MKAHQTTSMDLFKKSGGEVEGGADPKIILSSSVCRTVHWIAPFLSLLLISCTFVPQS